MIRDRIARAVITVNPEAAIKRREQAARSRWVDHRHQAVGHDPSVLLRHLTGILNATCTFPPCRRPQHQCDYEHSRPYDQGGLTCLCQAGPVCRASHRAKQSPGWHLEEAGARGWFRWTTPSGRGYLSRPTQYPD